MRRSLIIAIFLSLALLGQGGAASQPPAPGPLKHSSPPQEPTERQQDKSQYDKRGTKEFPLFIETIESESEKTEKDRNIKQREKETTNSRIGTFFTGGLLFVAICQLLFFYWQLNLMSKSMLLSAKAADAALSAANAAEKQAKAVILAERAYVRISSCPSGIILTDNKPLPSFALSCNLQIKNYGETPAHITDIVIKTCIEESYTPLPATPDYSTKTKFPFSHAFLVRGESIFYKFSDETVHAKETIDSVKDGRNALYLYGYVDYMDAFGNSHRGSFGRKYHPPYDDSNNYGDDTVPFKERNNLVFLMQDGYNDDRPRKAGTGA